jgi:hypothetical protein
MLLFLLKANIALTLFYLAYRFGLRRLTFYTLNRAFLLLAIVCAAICPFIDPAILFGHQPSLRGMAYEMVVDFNAMSQARAGSWINIVLINIFWVGVIVMSLRLLMQLVSLWRLHRSTRKQMILTQQVRVTDKALQPFSFLRNIYINPVIHTEAELSSIVQHEQVHVRQWHSVDVLLGELNKIFYWFNPGAWLISIAIRENLEFITDRYILQQGADIKAYQYSLLKVSGIPYATAIANNFNFSHLKQRIMMMNKKRSSDYNLARYVLLGSIVLLVLVSLNFSRAAVRQLNIIQKGDTGLLPPPPPPPPPPVPPPPPPPKGAKVVKVKMKTVPDAPVTVSPAPAPAPAGNFITVSDKTTDKDGKGGTNTIVVRGSAQPLYYIDNVRCTTVPNLSPENIESIYVYKDTEANGPEGKDGVIYIYTKGYNGKKVEGPATPPPAQK